MGRTWLRQDAQIQASQTFNQAMTVGSALQTSAVSIEDDLNAVRTQLSQVLDATGAGNWYDAVNTVNSKKRSIKQLNVGLDTIETKTLLARVNQQTTVAVPAAQNYVILSFAGGQTPSSTIAVATTALGAVVAKTATSGAGFATNELTVLAGTDTANPKNLCLVRNTSTGQAVETSTGSDVFALLQVESTAVDGASFNDTSAGNRAKLSFVTIDFTTGALTACPAAAVGGVTIQYSYVLRNSLSSMPEQYFIGNSSFNDTIGSVDVTLQTAYNNQGAPVNQNSNQTVYIGNTFTQSWQNAGGTKTLLSLNSTASATTATLSGDTLAVTTTNVPTFTKGISVGTATASQQINLGATANQIDTTGALTVAPTGALTLQSASNVAVNSTGSFVNFTDSFRAASTWTTTTSVKLAASTAEWTAYKTAYGEASLFAGIVAAGSNSAHSIRYANVTAANIPAGTNVTGAAGSPNIDTQLFNYSASSFTGQVKIYVNGQLMRPGANLAAGNDVYPGTTPANGDLMFAFALKNVATHTDVITMEIVQNGLYPT